MDFSKFDARNAAETPRDCHLRNQQTGELIWDGDKPCVVKVLGIASPTVQARIKDAARAQMKAKPEDDARTFEDLHQESIRSAARLIVGMENIHRGDALAKAPDDVEWLLKMTFFNVARDDAGRLKHPSFAQQVLECGADDAGFLANALKP